MKLPNSHVQVQHSTGCEDSLYSSLVLKASWSTLAEVTDGLVVRAGVSVT